jgi:hypothetical protein
MDSILHGQSQDSPLELVDSTKALYGGERIENRVTLYFCYALGR